LIFAGRIVNSSVNMIAHHYGHYREPKFGTAESCALAQCSGILIFIAGAAGAKAGSPVNAVGEHSETNAPLTIDHIVNKLGGNLRWRCP
jgi:hypothetical protein